MIRSLRNTALSFLLTFSFTSPAQNLGGLPFTISRGNPFLATPGPRTAVAIGIAQDDDGDSSGSAPSEPDPGSDDRLPHSVLDRARHFFPRGMTDEQAVVAYHRLRSEGIRRLLHGENIFISSHRVIARLSKDPNVRVLTIRSPKH
jgi:hypothetical protein